MHDHHHLYRLMKSITISVKRARLSHYGFCLFLVFFLCSCSSLINSVFIEPSVSNLQKQTDIHLVCEGGPSYLLMIDSLIDGDPDNSELLTLGAKAYSGYLTALTECGRSRARLQAIAAKARLYGVKRLAKRLPVKPKEPLESLDQTLTTLSVSEVEPLFWSTAAWTSWVFQQQGSPASMADLVKIEKIMLRLVELDESFGNGAMHLILGSYYGAKPKMIGGKPQLAADYFERGLVISKRQYLPLHVAYAQTYCRMTLNRNLHDNLLREVIDFKLHKAPEHALANQVAKIKAKKLMEENFFGE